jgi:catechol 2,3-dioxygenase-like lactoylglutathione lyase family enzyme
MIQHVAFEVRPDRWDACVDFYALLGFERVTPPLSLAGRAVWVQRGTTQVHLMDVEEPTVLPRGHVAVVVDAYDATLAALRDAGHDAEPRAQHWGSPRAYVRDPAGNLVELMAFPPDGG